MRRISSGWSNNYQNYLFFHVRLKVFPHNTVFGKNRISIQFSFNSSPRHEQRGFKGEKKFAKYSKWEKKSGESYSLGYLQERKKSLIQIQTFSSLLGLTCQYGTMLVDTLRSVFGESGCSPR